jgi:hypothetical protein
MSWMVALQLSLDTDYPTKYPRDEGALSQDRSQTLSDPTE